MCGAFLQNDVDDIKHAFRLYDPSDTVVNYMKRPEYVYWKGQSVNEEGFLDFSDVEEIVNNFFHRSEEWVTVFENGQQRIDSYPAHYTIYFNVAAFAAQKGTPAKQLERIFHSSSPYFHKDNLYRTELSEYFGSGYLGPRAGIFPLTAAGNRNFRHRQEHSIGVLLPEISGEMGVSIDPVTLSAPEAITSIEWQDAFVSGNQRRYRPSSEGMTLNVNRNLISGFLEKNNLSLYLCVSLRRSTGKHIPEHEMDWDEKLIVRPFPL